jgi:hypothetical protein
MAGLVPAIHVVILKWPQRGRPAPVPYGIGPPGPAWLFVLLACMERRAHGRAPLFRRKFTRIFLAAFSMG